jgi:hypothetical protein
MRLIFSVLTSLSVALAVWIVEPHVSWKEFTLALFTALPEAPLGPGRNPRCPAIVALEVAERLALGGGEALAWYPVAFTALIGRIGGRSNAHLMIIHASDSLKI